MGSVKVDIYKGEYEWHPVNLSNIDSIKGLIKNRSKFDLLFDRSRDIISLQSNYDLDSLCEEVICLYIELDRLISKCNFNDKQMKILKMYMKGYTQEDIAKAFNTTQPNIKKIITHMCKKICEQNKENWLNEFVLWDKKRVNTKYKKCSKCGEWLPATEEYFSPDNTKNDGFKYICKKCRTRDKKSY